MKRHESIIALSRDHHFGLLFCWKIRQGVREDIDPQRILPYVRYYWNEHLSPHFAAEEAILFLGKEADELNKKAIAEHASIKEWMLGADAKSNAAYYSKLADAVDNHIRFEERILFPQLEKTLSEEELTAIGNRLQQAHTEPPKDDYPDAFWEKDNIPNAAQNH